jgi:hypothetical protein
LFNQCDNQCHRNQNQHPQGRRYGRP